MSQPISIFFAGHPVGHFPLSSAQPNSLLSQLPRELPLHILSFLEYTKVAAASLVCRGIRELTQDNELWELLFHRGFNAPCLPFSVGNYKEAYKNEYRLCSNIAKGVFAPRQLSGHTADIYSLVCQGKQLFSGSEDKTIRVWDTQTGDCTKVLSGHQEAITGLAVTSGKLISTDEHNMIRVWDLTTHQCIQLHQGNEVFVKPLVCAEGTLFSSSLDGRMDSWNLETGEWLNTFQGHMGTVNSAIFVSGMLVSCADDAQIKIWDIKTGQCLQTFMGHQGPVRCLAVAGDRILSGGADGRIKIWDLKTGQCLNTLEWDEEPVNALIVVNGIFFSASDDSLVVIWDWKRGIYLSHLVTYKNGICALAFEGGKLFSCSDDQTIGVWDFNAPDRMIFQDIAQMFRIGGFDALEVETLRFSSMPKIAQEKIYEALHAILHPGTTEEGRAEDAFHDRNGLGCSLEDKAQAIENYMNNVPRVQRAAEQKENLENNVDPSPAKRAKKT